MHACHARSAAIIVLAPAPEHPVLPKVIILVLLAGIVAALFSGLFFLLKDESSKRRTLTALKIRVALSIMLLIFLALSFWNGWLQPHGLGK
jgi:hypothetical protein